MNFFDADECTLEYIADVGGRVVEDNSTGFSTNNAAIRLLREYKWTAINGGHVEAITNARDVGSHINTGDRLIGTPINKRIVSTTKSTIRVPRAHFA